MTEAQQNFIQAIEDDLARSDSYERVGLEADEEVTEARVQHLTAQTIEYIHQCLPEGEKRDLLLQRVKLAADTALLKLKTQPPSSSHTAPDASRKTDVGASEETVPDFFADAFEELRRTPSPRSRRQVTGDNALGAIVGLITGGLTGWTGGTVVITIVKFYLLPALAVAPFLNLGIIIGIVSGYIGGSHLGPRRGAGWTFVSILLAIQICFLIWFFAHSFKKSEVNKPTQEQSAVQQPRPEPRSLVPATPKEVPAPTSVVAPVVPNALPTKNHPDAADKPSSTARDYASETAPEEGTESVSPPTTDKAGIKEETVQKNTASEGKPVTPPSSPKSPSSPNEKPNSVQRYHYDDSP